MQTDLQVEVNGQKYPVTINEEGEFIANLGLLGGSSQIIKAGSYAELKKKVRKVKVSFALEFTEVMPNTTRNGTITGIHATNNNLLVRWEPEMIAGRPVPAKTEQLPGWQSGKFLPRLSEQDTEAVRFLIAERNRAARELENFTKPRAFTSLSQAARDAQAAAAGKLAEETAQL
jgi:transcriptional regulator of met regulon